VLYNKSGEAAPKAIIHIIGERPGSGHHAFSAYITRVAPATWQKAGAVDHDVTKVISGISNTGLLPDKAARETVKLLKAM
jgi:ethanolamine ammonia-lyase large subunit